MTRSMLVTLGITVAVLAFIGLLWYGKYGYTLADESPSGVQAQAQEQVTLQVVKLTSASEGSYVFDMYIINNVPCLVVDGQFGVGMDCDWDTRYFPEAP